MSRGVSTSEPVRYLDNSNSDQKGSPQNMYQLPDKDCPDMSAFGLGLISGSEDSITAKQEQLSKVATIFAEITSTHRIYEIPPPFENNKQHEQAIHRVIEIVKQALVDDYPQPPDRWIQVWVSALVFNPPNHPRIRLPFTVRLMPMSKNQQETTETFLPPATKKDNAGEQAVKTERNVKETQKVSKETRVEEKQTTSNKPQRFSRTLRPVNYSRPVTRKSLVATPRPLAAANRAADLEFAANTASIEEQKENISSLRRMFPTGQLPPFQKAEQALLDCKGDINAAYAKLGGKLKGAKVLSLVAPKSAAAGSPKGSTTASGSSTLPKLTFVGPVKGPITPPPKARPSSSVKGASTVATNESSLPLCDDSPSLHVLPRKIPSKAAESIFSPLPLKAATVSPSKSNSSRRAVLTTLLGTRKDKANIKEIEVVDDFHGLFRVVDRTAYRSGGDVDEDIDSQLSIVAQDYHPGFIRAFKDLKTDTSSSECNAQFEYEDEFYVSTDAKDALAPLKDLQNELALTQVKAPKNGEGLSLWEQCCLLFQIDPQKTGVNETVVIAGLNHPLYQFQAFAVYWLMINSRSMGGGFVADSPGLGKTLEFFAFLVVERQLSILTAEIAESLSQGVNKKNSSLTADGKHLSEEPHKIQDTCPSLISRPGWIKCPCMRSSPACRLDPIPGVRLAVVPEALMTNWRREWDTHIDVNSKDIGMRLLLAHQGSQVNAKISEVAYDPGNLDALKASFSRKKTTQDTARIGQEKFLVLTTAVAYETWIQKFQYKAPGSPLVNNLKLINSEKALQIAFGIACVDECHENFRAGKGSAGILAKLPGKKVIIWGLTGTPIENTIRSLEGILFAIESQYDKDYKSSESPWAQDVNLKLFRREIFDKLCKEVERETKAKRKSNPATINDFKNRFLPFLTQFMIRRTPESTWHGHSLIPLKPMLHQDITLAHNDKFDKKIKAMEPQFDAIISNTLREKQNQWKMDRSSLKSIPLELSFNDTINLLYKQKILATCPALVELTVGPGSLTLLWDELEKWNDNEGSSPYSKNLLKIVTNSPKLLWLRNFLIELDNTKDINGEEHKVVIVSQFSCICLIIKLMIERYIPRKAKRVGLVKPKQPTRDVAIILESFNDDVSANKQNEMVRKQKQNFQYLVGPVRQLGRGLQLTRACNVVLMEPDHKYDNELQAFARVNRIGQKNPMTFSYRLLDSGSDIEQDIIVKQMENNETPGPLVKDTWRKKPNQDEEGIIDDDYLYSLVKPEVQKEHNQDQQLRGLARSNSEALPDKNFLLSGILSQNPVSKNELKAKRTTLSEDHSSSNYKLPAKTYSPAPARDFVLGIRAEDEKVFGTKATKSSEGKITKAGGTS